MLWFVAALVVLAAPVAALALALIALGRVRSVESRLGTLRREIDALRERPSAPLAPAARPEPQVAPPASRPAAAAPAPVAPPRPLAPHAPRRRSVEANLGQRAFVWVGALALALAGVFLVKYTFDQGLLGPAARIALALGFGAGMLGLGEWLRPRAGRIAHGLAAAGIAVLYAGLLAGVNLYRLIPHGVGFALLALVTATAVAISLRHGALPAVLGLVGGFLTPALVGTEEPSAARLFLYLLVLEVGLLLATTRRRWGAIAGLALLGSTAWAAVWIAQTPRPAEDVAPLGTFLLATAAAFVVAGRAAADGGTWGAPWLGRGLAHLGVVAALGSLAALVGRAGFGPVEWTFFAVLGAGALVLGRLDRRYEAVAWIAAAFSAALLAAWIPFLEHAGAERFAVTAGLVGALYAVGGWAALWRADRPARWATLSTVAGVVFFLLCHAGLRRLEIEAPWGASSLGLAALYLALALPVARARATLAQGSRALAALAVAVTAFVSLAVPLELERAWITVAWAVEVPALLWLARRLAVPELRLAGGALAAGVAVRLLANPALLEYPIGTGILWNWLLYGYGVSIAAFACAAWLAASEGRKRLAEALESAGALFGFAWLTLGVRHYFHPRALGTAEMEFFELAALVVAWLGYGALLARSGALLSRRTLAWGGVAAAGVGLGAAVLGLGVAENPAWRPHEVGTTPIVNGLLFAYGLPAVLALLVARQLARREPRWLGAVFGAGALALTFVLVSLEVRHGFRGTLLAEGRASLAEWYGYSVAWIGLGVALLVVGIVARSAVARAGSLIVMVAAVLKVFLSDTAELRDLYRVLSLFGLGASLLALAFVYQRFVFRERPR